MTMNGPGITAQQHAFRAIRARVASTIPVETRSRNNGALPYVFVGPPEVRNHEIGHEIFLAIDVWSEKEGATQCQQLQHEVRLALHGIQDVDVDESNAVFSDTTELTADSEVYPAGYAGRWRFMLITEEMSRAQLEIKNQAWHGMQRFRLLAEARSE